MSWCFLVAGFSLFVTTESLGNDPPSPHCVTVAAPLIPAATLQEWGRFQQNLQDATRRISQTNWSCHFDNPSVALNLLQGDAAIQTQQGQCVSSPAQLSLRLGSAPDPSLSPLFACHSLQETVDRDSFRNCRPGASWLSTGFPPQMGSRRIEGTINYVGFVPGPYSYDTEVLPDGRLKIKIRIRFTRSGSTAAVPPRDLEQVRDLIRRASATWEANSPGHRMLFDFDVDQSPSGHPNIEVNLDPPNAGGRGPYFSSWGPDWTPGRIAHEMGHLMGLDDDYHQLRATGGGGGGVVPWLCRRLWGTGNTRAQTNQCDPRNLMCESELDGFPQPYNYYLIGRRMFCVNRPIEESCLPPHLEDRGSAPFPEPRGG